jgi:hypothetical protein
MFESFNPIQSLPVTIVTAALVIDGSIKTRLRRLTDVVNEPALDHLILFDATVTTVASRRVVASAPIAQLQLSDMLFLHASAPTESGGEARTAKQPIRATLITPPYAIEGLIHLPYEHELRQALDAFDDRFVPVTEASYRLYSVDEPPAKVDLLVVNRARAHIAIAAGAEWLSEAPDLGDDSSSAW